LIIIIIVVVIENAFIIAIVTNSIGLHGISIEHCCLIVIIIVIAIDEQEAISLFIDNNSFGIDMLGNILVRTIQTPNQSKIDKLVGSMQHNKPWRVHTRQVATATTSSNSNSNNKEQRKKQRNKSKVAFKWPSLREAFTLAFQTSGLIISDADGIVMAHDVDGT
jgi:hypothetical protein